MSKSSAKQRYVQFMEWLPTIKKASKEAPQQVQQLSRADYYKTKGVK